MAWWLFHLDDEVSFGKHILGQFRNFGAYLEIVFVRDALVLGGTRLHENLMARHHRLAHRGRNDPTRYSWTLIPLECRSAWTSPGLH